MQRVKHLKHFPSLTAPRITKHLLSSLLDAQRGVMYYATPPHPPLPSPTFPFLLFHCDSPFLSGTFTLVTTSIMPLQAGCIEHGPTVRVVLVVVGAVGGARRRQMYNGSDR